MPPWRALQPLLWLLVVMVAGLRLRLDARLWDDTYISMTGARNLLAGQGLHFSPEIHDHALTTLAWPALIALAGLFGAPLHEVVPVLGLLCELGLALAVALLALRMGSGQAGALISAALLLCNPVVLLCSMGGMETSLTLAVMACALLALSTGRTSLGLALAASLVWVRFDGLLFAAVIGGLSLVPILRARDVGTMLRVAWPAGLVLLGYFLLSYAYFGRLVPDSVAIKTLVDAPRGLAPSAAVARELGRALEGQSSYWFRAPTAYRFLHPLLAVGLVALLRAPRVRPLVLPLCAFTALYGASLWLRGGQYSTNFPWYFAPPLLLAALAGGAGAVALGRWVGSKLPRMQLGETPALGLAAALVLGWAWLLHAPLAASVEREQRRQDKRELIYAHAIIWAGQALDGTGEHLVAGNEIGALGYFAPPSIQVLDIFGLSGAKEDLPLSRPERVAKYRPALVLTKFKKCRNEIDGLLPGGYHWVLPRTGNSRHLLVGIRADLRDRAGAGWDMTSLERGIASGKFPQPPRD